MYLNISHPILGIKKTQHYFSGLAEILISAYTR